MDVNQGLYYQALMKRGCSKQEQFVPGMNEKKEAKCSEEEKSWDIGTRANFGLKYSTTYYIYVHRELRLITHRRRRMYKIEKRQAAVVFLGLLLHSYFSKSSPKSDRSDTQPLNRNVQYTLSISQRL